MRLLGLCLLASLAPSLARAQAVSVDQKVRAELKLDLGDRADSVIVQADNPLVQTSSSDLSATLGATQIQNSAYAACGTTERQVQLGLKLRF